MKIEKFCGLENTYISAEKVQRSILDDLRYFDNEEINRPTVGGYFSLVLFLFFAIIQHERILHNIFA